MKMLISLVCTWFDKDTYVEVIVDLSMLCVLVKCKIPKHEDSRLVIAPYWYRHISHAACLSPYRKDL